MDTWIQAAGTKEEYQTLSHKHGLTIRVSKRLRKVDAAKVAALVASIKREGMLQPIILGKRSDGSYDLIVGAHRLEAMQEVWRSVDSPVDYTMPVRIVIATTDARKVIEIAENLHRNDLSDAERRVLTAQYMELQGDGDFRATDPKVPGDPKVQSDPKAQMGRPDTWFSSLYEENGGPYPKKTAQRRWKEFCADTNRGGMTPSEAEKLDQTAFKNWLKKTGEQALADKQAQERASAEDRKALTLKHATEAYEKAKRIFHEAKSAYAKACDTAEKAGVKGVTRSL